MVFLNPIFLWAAFAVAIPIIIHLFNFRRPKRILFSDISLIREVRQTVVRKLRLRQWLLLALRILTIMSLVFAFANPVIPGAGMSLVTGGTSSVVIVLDNSYSMKAGNEKGEYWLQAGKLASEIIEAHGLKNEYLITSASDLKLNYSFSDADASLNDLKQLGIRQHTRSLPDLLKSAPDLFAKASGDNKIMYIIGDFQQSTVMADSLWEMPDQSVRVNLIPVATRAQKNIYVKNYRISDQLIEVGKPLTLTLTVVNDGNEAANDLGIQVISEGTVLAISNEDIPAGEQKEITVNFTPQQSGWQSGFIQLDDYPVEFDNRRYFTYYVPEKEPMLLVEGTPSTYLRLAFSDVLKQLDVTVVSDRDLPTVNLGKFKSIVLAGPSGLSQGMRDKLSTHLAEGKGLLIFPSEKTKMDELNLLMTSVQAGSFANIMSAENGIAVNTADLEHPLFEGVFVKSDIRREYDAPLVYKYFPFRPDNSSEQNIILRMATGEPFLTETRPGQGLIYTFNTFPDLSYTDFPIKSSFVPVLLRISRLMNQSRKATQNEVLGEGSYRMLNVSGQAQVRLVRAGYPEIIPEQYNKSGSLVLRFEKTDVPEGNYRIVQESDTLEKISFNIPDVESKMAAMQEAQLKKFLKDKDMVNVTVMPALPAQIGQEIEVAEQGFPMWKYFLIAAIIFLILEVILMKQKRNHE